MGGRIFHLAAVFAAAIAFSLSAAATASAQLCVLVCVGTGGGGHTASPPPRLNLGIADMAFTEPGVPDDVYRDLLVDSGAAVHRWSVSWENHEPQAGKVNDHYLRDLKAAYDAETARGIKHVIMVFGAPQWAVDPLARTPGGGTPCTDRSAPCVAPPNVRNRMIRSAWRDWIRKVVQTFPGAIGIEIWNEPNLQWAWAIAQDPELYALMLAQANAAVDSTYTYMPVLTGGLSTTKETNTRSTGMTKFLHEIYDTAGRRGFDGVSFHTYPCPFEAPEANLRRDLERVRAVTAARSDTGRPVWITETGATTSGPTSPNCGDAYTEATQGAALRGVIDWARRTHAAGVPLHGLLINSLLNGGPRESLDSPIEDGRYEYGAVAWTADPASGAFEWRAKPGFADLACALRGAC